MQLFNKESNMEFAFAKLLEYKNEYFISTKKTKQM